MIHQKIEEFQSQHLHSEEMSYNQLSKIEQRILFETKPLHQNILSVPKYIINAKRTDYTKTTSSM